MKKCINLANSTFNLYVLYIKLAQNTKQFWGWFWRTLLLSFISYSVEKAFYRLRPVVFGLLNIFPPLCQQVTAIQYLKCGNTYTGKTFAGTRGG